MVATDVPVGTLRRWIAQGWVTKISERPCIVDLNEVYAVIDRIGHGRKRATKTRRARRLRDA